MHARVGLAPQVVVGLQKNVEEAGKVFFAELRCGLGERRALLGRSGDQIRIGAANARDQQVAHVSNRFAAEVLEVAAFFLKGVDKTKGAVGRAGGDGFHQFVQRIFGNHAEQFAYFLVGNVVAAIGARLFEKRQGIAHAAFGHAGNDGDGAVGNGQILFFGDVFDALGDFIKGERAKMKMLGTRTDSVFELLGLRGGHDENDSVGGLFQSFQQGVGSFAGKHVGLVKDNHLAAGSRGSVAHHFAQFANLVNAAVGGRVNFDHVERGAGDNFLAGIADAARLGGRALCAVQCLGENAGGRSFSHAAGAGKNVGVGYT